MHMSHVNSIFTTMMSLPYGLSPTRSLHLQGNFFTFKMPFSCYEDIFINNAPNFTNTSGCFLMRQRRIGQHGQKTWRASHLRVERDSVVGSHSHHFLIRVPCFASLWTTPEMCHEERNVCAHHILVVNSPGCLLQVQLPECPLRLNS